EVPDELCPISPDPCFEFGHWYLGSDGLLYIVPDDRIAIAETHGPDNGILEELNGLYRDASSETDKNWFDKIDTDAICEKLGLSFVPGWQRRYDTFAGWYTV